MFKDKKTKIVATISDRRCEPEFLQQMIDCGMNVVRINTAHQVPETTMETVINLRKVSNTIPILIDTKGPEIRTTAKDEDIFVKTGDIVRFIGDPNKNSNRKVVSTNYEGFVRELNVGMNILIDDGETELEIIGKTDEYLECKALNDGEIGSRKSINVPGAKLNLPSLSEKDRQYVNWAAENNIDFIAHSFVRNKEDLIEIQEILDAKGSDVKLISKIENQEGVDNIDEILDHCYGIMVARGDLGIEVEAHKIPGIQRMLLEKARAKRKPVIIATQMLHTMIENPRPTRAEVSDVANAIYQGTDAIMLSGESAYGKYPIESITVMSKIAMEVETNLAQQAWKPQELVTLDTETSAFLTAHAVEASIVLGAKAVVADSGHGKTIRNLAGQRGYKPVYALCYNEKVMRELALSFGVTALMLKNEDNNNTHFGHTSFINSGISLLLDEKLISADDLVVVSAGNFGVNQGASFIEVSTAKGLMKNSK
jgi:pyruvate kinase